MIEGLLQPMHLVIILAVALFWEKGLRKVSATLNAGLKSPNPNRSLHRSFDSHSLIR